MESMGHSPLTVMSFNLRYGTADDGPDHWDARRQGVFDTVSRLRPNLIGLQEALDFQIQEILEPLNGYGAIGVGREDGVRGGEHAAILYDKSVLRSLESGTFWLSDHPDVPGSNDWGDSNVRVCTWSIFQFKDSTFAAFNTHLAVASQLAREKGVELILKRAAEHPGPVIVTGDFNADEDNRCVEEMRQAGFIDTYRQMIPDDPAPTFNGFSNDFSHEKIDYIWVRGGWDVVDADIVLDKINDRWISDHFPLTATLLLTGEAPVV